MAINLKRLSAKQLDALVRQIEEHKSQHRAATIAALRAKAMAMMQTNGLTLDDLFAGGARSSQLKGRKVAPKYRNPKDHSQTWSGRGRQPRWYAAALKAGKTERSLLIR